MRDEVDDVIVFSNRELTPMLVGERMGASARFKLFQPDELPEITRIVGLAT